MLYKKSSTTLAVSPVIESNETNQVKNGLEKLENGAGNLNNVKSSLNLKLTSVLHGNQNGAGTEPPKY